VVDNRTNDDNLVGTRARELTEAELAYVSGGATGRRIQKPIRWMTPVGTASA
jgi:hypothetical protein